jgi:hypothetical protein
VPVVFAPPPGPPPLRRDGDVFTLGACFSRAINRLMPTLDELGRRIATPFKKTPSFRLLSPAARAALKADQMHSRRVLLEVPDQPKRAVLNIARRVLNRNCLAIEA